MLLEKRKEGKDNIRPIQTKGNVLLVDEIEIRLRKQQIIKKCYFMNHSEEHSRNKISNIRIQGKMEKRDRSFTEQSLTGESGKK